MAKQITLEDLAESISDLGVSIGDMSTLFANELTSVRQEMTAGFAEVRQEMASGFAEVRQEMTTESSSIRQVMTTGFAEVHKNQRESNQRLESLEGSTKTLENDVHELYTMIGDLQKDVRNLSKSQSRRLDLIEAFAIQVAEKTGIPFTKGPA